MSYRHTLEAALESLHDIEVLVKGFPENGQIPSVEIDLALQKLRNLYELLLLVRGIEKRSIIEESKTTTVEVSSVTEEKKSERDEEKTVVTQNIIEEISEKLTTATRSATMKQTLADQFKGRPTLLESLSQTYNKEGETLAHSKPITDLMAAFALNDKFTFIRELFNNDKRAFEAAIESLNNAGSYGDAYDFMVQNYKWNMDDEAVQLLLSVLRRKYVRG